MKTRKTKVKGSPGKASGSPRYSPLSHGERKTKKTSRTWTPTSAGAPSGCSSEAAGVRHVSIEEERAGQRLDNFVHSVLKGVPKSWIYRCLRTGQIRVNGGRARPDRRLARGDTVRLPPVRGAAPSPTPRLSAALAESLRNAVLWEDEELTILDKPSGLAVHGGSGQSIGLIEAARVLWPEQASLELVHRLDKETSGCIVLAKSRPALRHMHAALRSGEVGKEYLALVRGRWTRPRAISSNLYRAQDRSGERRVQSGVEGKPSQTRFVPLTPGVTASLVRAWPQTGRTHQIRVHAASVGHPLAGDRKYGHRQFNARLRELGLRRLFLHAAALTFRPPGSDEVVTVEAKLPAELLAVLDALGLRND